jgi:hypothetical protein
MFEGNHHHANGFSSMSSLHELHIWMTGMTPLF